MKIFVVRHGLTRLNQEKKVNGEIDEPLIDEGVAQATAAIPFIPKSVTYIYTSSASRARQTGEILNRRLKLPISAHPELTEIRMGTLAGKSWQEMEGGETLRLKHRQGKFNYQKYGGESAEEVTKRITVFFQKIKGRHTDLDVLVITHGGIIRLMHLLTCDEELLTELGHVQLQTFDIAKILTKVKV